MKTLILGLLLLTCAAQAQEFGGEEPSSASSVSIGTFGSTPTANGATAVDGAITLQPADATHPGSMVAADKVKLDAISGTNTGNVSVSAYGSTPNASGISLSGQALTLQPADATNPGGVSTGSQTFGGTKTFSAIVATTSTETTANITNLTATGGTFSVTGHLSPAASSTYRLGTGGSQWLEAHILTFYLYNALYTSGNFPVMLKTQSSNGASANELEIDGFTAFTTAGSTIFQMKNGGVLKASVSYDGSYKQAAITLQTCSSTTEGLISRDAAGGGTTGHRTKVCVCTSDGGGTPAYAWTNLGSGTVGNTTTCSD